MTDVGERVLDPEPESGTETEAATHMFDMGALRRESGPRPRPALHLTPVERAARGREARGEVPRSAHADWQPRPERRDPIALLEEQAQTRLPELGPIRYGRMLVSPFAFFRGAAYLMAADLADTPRTVYTRNCAVTRICRTSASLQHRIGGVSSASATSTRRCPARSSGM